MEIFGKPLKTRVTRNRVTRIRVTRGLAVISGKKSKKSRETKQVVICREGPYWLMHYHKLEIQCGKIFLSEEF